MSEIQKTDKRRQINSNSKYIMRKPEVASPPSVEVRPGRIARNALWLSGGEFLSRLIGLGLAIYLARVLGAEGYGLIGTALAFVSYFTIFIAAGVDFHGVRDIAQQPEKLPHIVGHILGMRLLLLLAACIALILLVWLLPSRVIGRIDLVAIYAVTLLTFTLNTAWALRGMQQMQTIAIGLVFQSLFLASATFLLVREPSPSLWLIPAIQVVSECFLAAWYYRYIFKRFGPLRPIFDWVHLWPTLKETLHLSLGRFPRIFYYQGDVLLLAWLTSAASAGEFLASHKIIMSIATMGIIYQLNAYPVTSRLAMESPIAALHFQMNILRYALTISMPLVVLGTMYAEPLIHMIYGSAFRTSSLILFWMLFTIPVFEVSIAMQDVLTAVRKNNAVVIANTTAMLVHIGVGLLIIPNHLGVGAALACLVGELLGLLLLAGFVWNSTRQFPFSVRMLMPLPGGGLMYAVLQLSTPQHWATQVGLGLLIYALALVLLKTMTRNEITHIWQYLTRLVHFGKRIP